jgi:hypothetical protein
MSQRNQRGQFLPGQSGNPAGRPKNKPAAETIRKRITRHLPEIIETLIREARAGDVQAAKVLLDHACTPLSPKSSPIPFGESLIGELERCLRGGGI